MLKLLGVLSSGFDGFRLGKIGQWCGKLATSWPTSGASWLKWGGSGPASSWLPTSYCGSLHLISGREYLSTWVPGNSLR